MTFKKLYNTKSLAAGIFACLLECGDYPRTELIGWQASYVASHFVFKTRNRHIVHVHIGHDQSSIRKLSLLFGEQMKSENWPSALCPVSPGRYVLLSTSK
jgi:hypothetical protein